MATIHTVHSNETGTQQTKRIVTVEDATGEEHSHEFFVTDDGHEYQGDGTPPESALDALADQHGHEFSSEQGGDA